jgi:hypothetical protein
LSSKHLDASDLWWALADGLTDRVIQIQNQERCKSNKKRKKQLTSICQEKGEGQKGKKKDLSLESIFVDLQLVESAPPMADEAHLLAALTTCRTMIYL